MFATTRAGGFMALTKGTATCSGDNCDSWNNRYDMLFPGITTNGSEAQFKANPNPYDVAKCQPNTEHSYLIYNAKTGKYQRHKCLKKAKDYIHEINHNAITGERLDQQYKMIFEPIYGSRHRAKPKLEKGTCGPYEKNCGLMVIMNVY